MVLPAAITNDHRVLGLNPPGAPFSVPGLREGSLFPLLKNSEFAEVSLP